MDSFSSPFPPARLYKKAFISVSWVVFRLAHSHKADTPQARTYSFSLRLSQRKEGEGLKSERRLAISSNTHHPTSSKNHDLQS